MQREDILNQQQSMYDSRAYLVSLNCSVIYLWHLIKKLTYKMYQRVQCCRYTISIIR